MTGGRVVVACTSKVLLCLDHLSPQQAQLFTAEAHAVLAVDFADVDTVFLRRLSLLVKIDRGCRRVHLVWITAHGRG
jgi:hypothetical protein